MMRSLLPTALAAALALVPPALPATGPAPGADAAPALHLRLDRSAPEADTTVASPAEIRLWFSQVPQAGATSARLVFRGAPVEALGELEVDEDDGSVFAAPVREVLAPGVYTVSWRTMAADGHVVRGDFDFTVQAQ